MQQLGPIRKKRPIAFHTLLRLPGSVREAFLHRIH